MLPDNKRDDARRIAGVAEFMGRAALTTCHVKSWCVLKTRSCRLCLKSILRY